MRRRHRPDPPARRALLVDGLGTLVWLAPPAPALRQELARRGVAVSDAQAQAAIAAEIAFYRAHMLTGRDGPGLAALHRRCGEVVLGALPASPGLAAAGVAGVTEALLGALRFHAFADARRLLVRARAAGARVVVVSNWDVSLPDVLERVGLAPLLDGVVTSAAVGAAKPAGAIFAHALALAGAGPEAALHVGDSLDEDVRGAQACGIEAVLLARDAAPAAAGAPASVRAIAGLDELGWP